MPPVECCPAPFRTQIIVVGRQVEYVVRVVVRMRECILRFYFYKSRKLIAGWKTPVMLRRYVVSNEEGQRQALAAADSLSKQSAGEGGRNEDRKSGARISQFF